jgi:hypothetical protein
MKSRESRISVSTWLVVGAFPTLGVTVTEFAPSVFSFSELASFGARYCSKSNRSRTLITSMESIACRMANDIVTP